MTCSDIAQLDFPVKQGTDFRRTFRFKDSAGVPIDIAGYVFPFKAFHDEGTITQNLVPTGDPGEAELHLTITQTRQVPIGRLMRYALEIRAPGDNPPGSGDQSIPLEGFLIGEQGADNDD